MAENKSAEQKLVRYRVDKPTFVNGVFCDPEAANPLGAERGKDGKTYVMAAPGLEGAALKRAQGSRSEAPPPKAPNGDNGGKGDETK